MMTRWIESRPHPGWRLVRPALALLGAAFCLPARSGAQEPGLHPNPRYLEAPLAPSFTIALSAPPVAQPFSLAPTPSAAFGTEGDSGSDLIGTISAALLLPSGHVVLLDAVQSELRIFDATGRPTRRLGRAGRGPGEFSDPLSLAADTDGRLYVADLAHAIQVFAPGPAGYRYERTLHIEVAARGMCFLNGRLVVQGMKFGEDPILRAYDRSGRVVRSFGTLYRSPNRLLNYQFSEGRIACDAQRGLILYAPYDVVGEVRAYRADGTAVWRTLLTGYKVNRIEDYQGGVRVSGAEGVHSVHTFTLLPGRGLLVQVAFQSEQALRDRIQFTTLHSFLFDPATGRPLPLGDALPPIVAAEGRNVVLAFDDPVPRFEVRTLQGRLE